MNQGGGYAVPSRKPFIGKLPLKKTPENEHRKAVKEFCSSHDISFANDSEGRLMYKITDRKTGKTYDGIVSGDESV